MNVILRVDLFDLMGASIIDAIRDALVSGMNVIFLAIVFVLIDRMDNHFSVQYMGMYYMTLA